MRCLSPEVHVLVHAGYELSDKDYLELHLLRERFGVTIPDAFGRPRRRRGPLSCYSTVSSSFVNVVSRSRPSAVIRPATNESSSSRQPK